MNARLEPTPALAHGRVPTILLLMTICIELCVSANLLTYMGVPYVTDGSSPLLKLHPGTDLLFIMFATSAVTWRSGCLAGLDGELKAFLTAMFGSILCATIFTGFENLIVLLDTFVPAGLIAVLLAKASKSDLLLVRRVMQCIFVINAILSLAETWSQATLIPLYIDDGEYHPHHEDFRPTALYDHPLTGALMTMMALALAPSPGGLRMAYRFLMWAALIAFGGRMAIGISVLALVLRHAVEITSMIVARDESVGRRLLLSACGLLLLMFGFAAAVPFELADRLAGHLFWDASAQVRLAQWDILTHLDGWELLLGTPRHELLQSLNALRLSSGVGVIENPWILMFVSLGIFGFTIFLFGISALCSWLWQRSDRAGKILLTSILFVASSSNSLGRKSTVLVCLVASLACIRRESNEGVRATTALGVPWRGKAA